MDELIQRMYYGRMDTTDIMCKMNITDIIWKNGYNGYKLEGRIVRMNFGKDGYKE
jgi:hypothetical protein